MTNSLRGAVPFEVAGRPMALCVTVNAQVRYQDVTDETFLTGLVKLQKDPSDMRRMRRLFWAALSHVADVSEEMAGEWAQELGALEAVKLLGEAVTAAFPATSGNVSGGRKGRPQ